MSEETSLVRQSTVIAPRTLDEVVTLSEKIAKSGLLPEALRGKVPEVMMQIMAGAELGLAPMASLRSFSIITGKPVMSADAMVAVVLGSGKCEYFRRVSESDKEVTYATKRNGQPERRCQWTMDMAKVAALHQKDNWRTFPRAMLASRAKSELARDVYPDILAGVFTAEEIEPSRPIAASDVIEASFVDIPDEPAEAFAMDAAPTIAELKRLAGVTKAMNLGDDIKRKINERYTARMAFLKTQPIPAANEEQAAITVAVAEPSA